ncbi:SRPBCC family protein [Streptacidiphilus neutrinimicus]|uniref:SRPBCC family protein n=1 Tax=Streptacidiphilus neutrinimicus TaxID=105420 RepID=UPI000693482C|nr:SRPBCC family protein [Streptacidiphilus neutrinimicus]
MAAPKKGQVLGTLMQELPTDLMARGARKLLSAAGERAISMAEDKASEMTDRLLNYAENGSGGNGGNGDNRDDGDGGGNGGNGDGGANGENGDSGGNGEDSGNGEGGGGGRGGRGGGKKLKLTNIIEQIDVGVPVRVAYNQWTQFQDFPKYTKRLETVEQESDEKLTWKAGIFLSHRTWQATIIEQVPDELIVWQSKGEKGRVDGAVTFHELAPNLTRILVVLEYHPQGLFERTGNIWRAQGRRARLELKHFRRHVMTQTILDPDGVEGWRGEIRDGEVVRTHEDAMQEEEEARAQEEAENGEEDDEREDEDQYEDEYEGDEDEEPEEGDEDEAEDYEPEDEDAEDQYEEPEDEEPEDEEPEDEEPEDEEPEDEEPEDEEPEDEEPEDEYDDEDGYDDEEEPEDEPARRSRSRRTAARGR